jgi:hypothetical protein
MREVLSSAAEAELAGLFHNCKEACPIRIALEELGFPQPATPIQTDNSTACGIANDTVKQRRSKAIDMRFYWIKDRVRQGHFFVYWKPGKINQADYFTKHHPPSHHQEMRPLYLLPESNNRFAALATIDEDEDANDITIPFTYECCEGVLRSSPGIDTDTRHFHSQHPYAHDPGQTSTVRDHSPITTHLVKLPIIDSAHNFT